MSNPYSMNDWYTKGWTQDMVNNIILRCPKCTNGPDDYIIEATYPEEVYSELFESAVSEYRAKFNCPHPLQVKGTVGAVKV